MESKKKTKARHYPTNNRNYKKESLQQFYKNEKIEKSNYFNKRNKNVSDKTCKLYANFILSLCKHISCHRSFEIQINNQGLEPVA